MPVPGRGLQCSYRAASQSVVLSNLLFWLILCSSRGAPRGPGWTRGQPELTIKRYRAHIQGDNAVYIAQRERVAEGMRVAGWQEGITASFTVQTFAGIHWSDDPS